jgi:hypothetical protein
MNFERNQFLGIISKVLSKLGENAVLMSIVVAMYVEQNEWSYISVYPFVLYKEEEGYCYGKIKWSSILDDILKGSLDLSKFEINLPLENVGQFGKNRFHPSPVIDTDIFTPKRREILSKICKEMELDLPESFNILTFYNFLSSLENKFDVSDYILSIDKKRSGIKKKNTQKAKYTKFLSKEERSHLPKQFQSDKDYKSAIGLLGVLRGRMNNTLYPSVQAVALAMDKIGLSVLYPDPEDPHVDAFVSLVKAGLSRQKLFTIDSQMHGGLDIWMKTFLDILISRMSKSRMSSTYASKVTPIKPISQDDWKKIFFLVPSPEVSQFLDESTKRDIYDLTLSWMQLFSVLFQEQWELGVKVCSADKMMVPRSGTTQIHVNAWNACAGAWGNLLRIIRLLGNELGLPNLNLYKVLKLTAGDQMKWAEYDGKGAHADTDIFYSLTSEECLPWTHFHNSVLDFSEKIVEKCTLFSVNPQKWLGGPCIRMTETKGDIRSLCGVVLPGFVVDTVKGTGACGSNPWGNSKDV